MGSDPDDANAPRRRRRALRELPAGSKVQETFVVQRAEVRTARSSGAHYLALVLRDAAGSLEARMFDVESDAAEAFVAGEPLRFTGTMERYRNAPQLVVERYHEPSKVEQAELVATSDSKPESMLADLQRILATIRNPHLMRLRDAYFADREFLKRLQLAPATAQNHRAWRHGLLEHLVAALELAETICLHYPWLDRDVVLMGVFLHDSGKAFALTEQGGGGGGEAEYTHAGKLLGAISLGVSYLERKLRELGEVPHELGVALCHCVAAHPGQTSWGAHKPPMTPEAVVVHHIDALDSTLGHLRELQQQQQQQDDTTAAAAFRYSTMLRREVLLQPDKAPSDEYDEAEQTVEPDEPAP